MKFKCDNCGHNKFEIKYDYIQHYESGELMTFSDARIDWLNAGDDVEFWAVCLGCGKEFNSQYNVMHVKEYLVDIGVLL